MMSYFKSMSHSEAVANGDLLSGLRYLRWRLLMPCWGGFICCAIFYCRLHGTLLPGDECTWFGSVFRGISGWMTWALLTPALLHFMVGVYQSPKSVVKKWLFLAGVIAAGACLSLALRVVFFGIVYSKLPGLAEIGSAFLGEFPKGIAVILVLTICWFWLSKFQLAKEKATLAASPKTVEEPTAPLEEKPTNLLLQGNKGKVLVEIADIVWIGAAGNYLEVHTMDQSFLLRQTMKECELQLPSSNFTRIHRSIIVNHLFVEQLQRKQGGGHVVVMKNGKSLAMSRTYKARFEKKLNPFCTGKVIGTVQG